MLRRLASTSLRRFVHTSYHQHPTLPPRFPKLGFALGATTVVATYLALRLSLDSEKVSLDGPSPESLSKPVQSSMRYPSFSPPLQQDGDHVRAASKKLQEQEHGLVHPPNASPLTVDTPLDTQSPESSQPSPDTHISSSTFTEARQQADTQQAEGDAQAEDESGPTAFNPVTGEINWDCPCLGGMAHGPCGQQFREAFSCFVFSEQEPKGIDCVEKFKAMQNCFREHPEIYAEEIMNDDEDDIDSGVTPSSAESTISSNPATTAPPQPSDIPSGVASQSK